MNTTSWGRQLGIYTGKFFRLFVHEKKWFVFFSTLLIDFLLLFVLDKSTMFIEYTDTRTGLFAITCTCIWVGVFNSVQAICSERATVKHEHMEAGLSLSAYVCAHLIYEVFLCAVESVLTEGVIIAYFKEAVENSRFSPVELFFSLFLLTLAADTLGLLISSLAKTAESAMTVMPFVLIVQLVLSGFIFTVKGLTKAASMLTLSKWGMRALCVAARINQYPPEEIQSYEFAVYQANIREYNTGGARILLLWLILLLFAAAFSALCVFALRLVDKDKR